MWETLNSGIIPAHNHAIGTERGKKLWGRFYDNYE
jgi:hypothetical protein